MYVPPAFALTDLAAVHDLIDRARVASLVTLVDGQLTATTVPLLLDRAWGEQGRLVGHLARANPQARVSDPGVDALAIFDGVSDYVSPSMYPTKAETGEVVPTWNYEVVHVSGPLQLHDDPAWVLDLVTRLTDHHERATDGPAWAVSDAPTDFINRQLRAIVGIEIPVVRMVGKRKLSQNRSPVDRGGVVAAFRRRAGAGVDGAAAMVEAMGGSGAPPATGG